MRFIHERRIVAQADGGCESGPGARVNSQREPGRDPHRRQTRCARVRAVRRVRRLPVPGSPLRRSAGPEDERGARAVRRRGHRRRCRALRRLPCPVRLPFQADAALRAPAPRPAARTSASCAPGAARPSTSPPVRSPRRRSTRGSRELRGEVLARWQSYRNGATLLVREASSGVTVDPRAVVTETVGDLSLQFLAGDFFQNNPFLLPAPGQPRRGRSGGVRRAFPGRRLLRQRSARPGGGAAASSACWGSRSARAR